MKIRWPRATRRDERGAVAVMVAITSTVLLLAAAFAIDLGMQRVARSDTQALVDVISLDLARDLDGVNSPKYFDAKWAAPSSTMEQSLRRNASGVGTAPSALAPWICATQACVTAVAGYLDASGAFHAYPTTDTSDIPTAVQVSATSQVSFGLGSVTGVGSGAVNRTAVAIGVPASTTTPTPVSKSSNACVAVGSYLLRASTSNSLLSPLIGNALGVTAVGYQGVATMQVNVGKLAADTTLGTVSNPLSTSVTLGTLLTAMANASDSAAAIAINNFAKTIPIPKLNTTVGAIGTILNVNNSGALANATVTAGDLLAGAASLMNGQNFASIALGVSLGGISNFQATIKVIQPPQIACYPNVAKAGQVQVVLTGSSLLLGTVTIKLVLAQADAVASTLTCNGWTPTALGVTVSNQAAATAQVDATGLLGVLGLILPVGVGSPLSVATAPASTQSLNLTSSPSPAPYYDPTFYTGTPAATTLIQPATGGGLLAGLLSGLNSVTSDLNTKLLSVVSNTLGVNLAGADVAAERTPSCVTTSLAG